MNNDNDNNQKVKRREFLSSAAIPVAAALMPPALFAQASRPSTSAAPETIRLGIVGAGGIVSSVHIPGFRQIPGVEIVAVANRSLESSQRAADRARNRTRLSRLGGVARG